MVECLPGDLGLVPATHKQAPAWDLSTQEEEARKSQGQVILRLHRKFRNTEDHVYPQPTPYPLKGERLLTVPTFDLVRHILPSLFKRESHEGRNGPFKTNRREQLQGLPASLLGQAQSPNKGLIGTFVCFGTLAPPGPLPPSCCCGGTRGLARHPGKETAALPGAQ